MSTSLRDRIQSLVQGVLSASPARYMVWCDPHGYWLPLVEKSVPRGKSAFTLVPIEDTTAGDFGSPAARAQVQARLDIGEPLVIVAATALDNLGWLWAQALLAERIYARSLREQLLDWGWRPQSLNITDKELAAVALQNLNQDPAEWGGGGLQPRPELLLHVLSGTTHADPEQRIALDVTAEHLGLPPIPWDGDEQALERWRTNSLANLLVTDAHRRSPGVVPETHEALISAGMRSSAMSALDRWADSTSLSKALVESVPRADAVASLPGLLGDSTAEQGPFVSFAAEQAVFANTCKHLAGQAGTALLSALASIRHHLAAHRAGFWGERQPSPSRKPLPWAELLRLSDAAQLLLDASPGEAWASPEEATSWYTERGWRVDQAGEEFLKNLSNTTPELLTLLAPVRAAYRARWEEYMRRWSDVWVNAGCPVPTPTSAGDWMLDVLRAGSATAILVIDALRYDLGAALAERVNEQEGAERAAVSPARAPLPSITAVGMGMNMPIPEADLRADIVDGKWQLRQKGRPENLSNAQQRRQWWHQYGKVDEGALLTMQQIVAGEIPEPAANRARLVAYDDAIDKLGHDDELEALGGSLVLDRYLTAIEHLRDKGWRRVLIVTDHGFIHWDGREERNVPLPAEDPVYSSRRAAAYHVSAQFEGPQGLAPGGLLRVAVPRGAASFRTYGGLGYFHGGASLQEWIIPCLRIEWPGQARPVTVRLEVLYQVLGQRPHVTLHVGRESLFVEDALPRQVDVVIRDAQTRTVLFRSEPVKITPGQETLDISLRDVPAVEAARGTQLRVEVRDLGTDEILDSCDSTLMIELSGW